MKAHITKHKKKYGFVAAVGVAGFSFNALIQQPATVPEPANPTISQRQEIANQRLEADKQRCNEWIPQEKRVALFGAAFDTIGGQFFFSYRHRIAFMHVSRSFNELPFNETRL